MSSTLWFALTDMAALIERGLGERVRAVTCLPHLDGFRLRLQGLDPHARLPRLTVVLDCGLAIIDGLIEVTFTVAPTTWSALVLVPGQRLGGGRMVVEPIIERLGLQAAVVSLSDRKVVLAPDRLPGLTRLGLIPGSIEMVTTPEAAFLLHFSINRNG